VIEDLESRFEQMLAADCALAQGNMIVRDNDGGFEVFGRWQLRPKDGRVAVVARGEVRAVFTDMKKAVSWCIAEKYHQQELAQEILRLERDLQRLEPSLATERWISQHTQDPVKRSILVAKTQETQRRWLAISRCMQRCVWRAKYLQTKGFNDEIARTRYPVPHRTGRNSDRKPKRTSH
jgi:hypothetical protein